LLPTQEGFFSGSTNYDQWYFDDITFTKETLEKLLVEEPDADYYSSSPGFGGGGNSPSITRTGVYMSQVESDVIWIIQQKLKPCTNHPLLIPGSTSVSPGS
jgi:hypothetical protein